MLAQCKPDVPRSILARPIVCQPVTRWLVSQHLLGATDDATSPVVRVTTVAFLSPG